MYRLGASPSQVDAQQKADAAKAAFLSQFDRFAAIMTQGASDVAGDQPALANAMRNAIPRLRHGVDNVLAGKTDPDAWAKSVNALIAQARAEAPTFSWTTAMSAGDSTVNAAKAAGRATAALAVATAATAGKAVKAASEGAGLDLQHNIDQAASTTKIVVAFGAVAVLAYALAPAIKVMAMGKERQLQKQSAGA